MTLELSPKVATILGALVEERTGLSFGLREQALFADKVLGRVREAGFESVLDYYYYLRYDAGSARELDALIAALVVTETYFFREADALRIAVSHFLAPAVAEGHRPRVWSAACASGDEPLTLAVLLDEVGLLGRVEIVATDLSLEAFERARREGWSARSLRAMPPGVRGITRDGDRARVDERLVSSVEWGQMNLLDMARTRSLGSFDLILCRNVLIYFSDETILRVVDNLAAMLRPRGRLLVGASESLMRFGTLLECEERSGAFFYRVPK